MRRKSHSMMSSKWRPCTSTPVPRKKFNNVLPTCWLCWPLFDGSVGRMVCRAAASVVRREAPGECWGCRVDGGDVTGADGVRPCRGCLFWLEDGPIPCCETSAVAAANCRCSNRCLCGRLCDRADCSSFAAPRVREEWLLPVVWISGTVEESGI